MHSRIRLDAGLKKPLYQQLVEAISEKIDRGEFAAGERLPSVRDLAMEVRINPNTVARAYQELEKASVVFSQPGRGVFVRQGGATEPDVPEPLGQALDHVIDTARAHDYPLEKLPEELRRRTRAAIRKESRS